MGSQGKLRVGLPASVLLFMTMAMAVHRGRRDVRKKQRGNETTWQRGCWAASDVHVDRVGGHNRARVGGATSISTDRFEGLWGVFRKAETK